MGGFRFLGGRKGEAIPQGNFYFAGQRRHVEREAWDTVEFFSLWTYDNRALRKDRDRGLVTRSELHSIIAAIIAAAPQENLIHMVYSLEPIWTERTWATGYRENVGSDVLEQTVNQIEKQNGWRERVQLDFAEKYLAEVLLTPSFITEALAAQGYIICNRALERLGMKTVVEKFRELQQHYRTEPSPVERERMGILYEAITPLKKRAKEIWLFDREAENNIVHGQYVEQFVWMSREQLQGPFHTALATYLHELDHTYGSDVSAEFSYALTDTLEAVIKATISQSEAYQQLQQRWEQHQK